MVAMTGVIPRRGDVVHILQGSSRLFADSEIRRFRVWRAEPLPGHGWCELTGWDLDADPQHLVTYDLLVSGLIFRPGDQWGKEAVPHPGFPSPVGGCRAGSEQVDQPLVHHHRSLPARP
jgi:hypothetical protein